MFLLGPTPCTNSKAAPNSHEGAFISLPIFLHKAVPYALAAGITFSLLSTTVDAQSQDTRQRRVMPTASTTPAPAVTEVRRTRLENEPVVDDPVIVSLAEEEEVKSLKPLAAVRRSSHFNQLLQAAIDLRLGAPYVYGAAGPTTFDCSGFVWAVFQSAGLSFTRTSANALWVQLPPASKSEARQFGTLVFFSGLTHVGIVADENGFYHASRSQGVTYSLFDEYWSERLDGFRRMPPAVARLGG